ncbi:hypothetical protein GCM10022409_37810 [Hymenobacter glaciei]|uniref:WGR domain-containing protein n=1 Tax=Hymenobacter glaciei TaxID=877209 RepID=A0ABP7UMW0_9BACT
MIKLYQLQNGILHYWETWDKTPKSGIIHWGVVGERGTTTPIRATGQAKFRETILAEINKKREEGFAESTTESVLVIEYAAETMTSVRLKKLNRLEEKLDQLMGWTGLGYADGNGFGFGMMDVSVVVVDFEIAKRVIEAELEDSEFARYTSISQVEIDEDEPKD